MKIVRAVSKTVLLLSVVSLLNDLSSEMIMAVLPLFITALGGGGLSVGLIGGIEESIKSILSAFMGYFSDRSARRGPFVIAGYAVSSLSKLALPFSGTWVNVLGLRFLDRTGKGLRTAPRDAMIADSIDLNIRGLNFGFHRAMDTAGALLGSLAAFLLFWVFALELKPIILLGGVLALISLLPLFFVRERPHSPPPNTFITGLRQLPKAFQLNLAAMTIFALANFSYMFFLLKVSAAFTDKLAIGMPLAMYIVFNTAYTLLPIPFGILSDKIGRRNVLVMGYSLFGLMCLGFAFSDAPLAFGILFVLYGTSYACIEGNQRAFVSDLANPQERGTALGVFHFSIGIAALLGSLLAGFLWQFFAPEVTFFYGGALALLGALALRLVPKQLT